MESIQYSGIVVERCTGCKGIWFDMLEKEHLAAIAGSEAIDTGDPKVGKKYNEIGNVDCPKCKVKMLRMVDARQRHIWYESCPQCYGLFFDAGEFKDYKHETILDFFKDLLSKERK